MIPFRRWWQTFGCDTGSVKKTFCCPLTVCIVDEDNECYPVSSRFLRDYAESIQEAIERGKL